jgi:hypothetical protein
MHQSMRKAAKTAVVAALCHWFNQAAKPGHTFF